jgi:hypothetical protein
MPSRLEGVRRKSSLAVRRIARMTEQFALANYRPNEIAPADVPTYPPGNIWLDTTERRSLNRQHIDEMLGRSLMLVIALSPIIGYDKPSVIAHRANDDGLTLKAVALKSGYIDARRFDEIVDPRKMVGHGAGGS